MGYYYFLLHAGLFYYNKINLDFYKKHGLPAIHHSAITKLCVVIVSNYCGLTLH